jgi:uncharacterized protein (DUF1501 family)
MITFTITISFPEPNGLAKEAELQHTTVYQLSRLAIFWSSQHGITVDRTINEDNSQKVITYTFDSKETYDNFNNHTSDNGVIMKELVEEYKAEMQRLGATWEYVTLGLE